MSAPKPTLIPADFFERPVTLRLPFRFGVVTLTEAPQVFVRARIRLSDGREGKAYRPNCWRRNGSTNRPR